MIKADGHLHSFFSFDGKASMAEMAAGAFARDLSTITMTEHFSVCSFDPSYQVLEYENYSREISILQNQYQGKMEILKGMEIGEPHVQKQDITTFLQDKRLDIIIGSLHNIGQLKLRQTMEGKERRQIYQDYFDALLLMVQEGDMDVIGHFDLMKRYAYTYIGGYEFLEFEEIIREILSVMVTRGIGLEINTSGWEQTVGECFPTMEIMCLYRQLGGEIITIGSDAHTPHRIGSGFDRVVQMLQAFQFSYYCSYKNRQPEFLLWRE